jgi:PilZ domain
VSGERRAWRRVHYARGALPPDARVHPARDVIVVNLSRGGALVEGGWRFRPGATVTLHLRCGTRDVAARSVIERCVVHALERGGVRYRAALRFDEALSTEPPADALSFA